MSNVVMRRRTAARAPRNSHLTARTIRRDSGAAGKVMNLLSFGEFERLPPNLGFGGSPVLSEM
jgi:hypothetical protein